VRGLDRLHTTRTVPRNGTAKRRSPEMYSCSSTSVSQQTIARSGFGNSPFRFARVLENKSRTVWNRFGYLRASDRASLDTASEDVGGAAGCGVGADQGHVPSLPSPIPSRSWPDACYVPHDARRVHAREADRGSPGRCQRHDYTSEWCQRRSPARRGGCDGSSCLATPLIRRSSPRSAGCLPGRGCRPDYLA
jgi:hypothetical protein